MFGRKLYSYHVGYAHQNGFGMAELTTIKKVKTYKDVKEVKKLLEERGEVSNIVILSFHLMGKVQDE